MTLALLICFSLLGSAGSALLASLLFLRQRTFSPAWKSTILSYATGSLLGAALLGMLPHALEHLSARLTLTTVLAGLLTFFVLEKLLIWRHCHDIDCPEHSQAGSLILVGDAVHNAVDGVAIGLAFTINPALGIATSLAVIAHEIPQEVGDVMILIHSGIPPRPAIGLNVLSSLTTLPAALGVYLAGDQLSRFAPFALAISAASFLYIALADLTPDHRRASRLQDTLRQVMGIGAGITTIALIQGFTHP